MTYSLQCSPLLTAEGYLKPTQPTKGRNNCIGGENMEYSLIEDFLGLGNITSELPDHENPG